ncbi:SDR family NAD(P)-dependent oxidoreductase [Actinacidiphila acididurans]|jgi:3-oxoacyl-[acyl-carrier protein] reductase|uniref:SDR family oxidoreductase n=1 Tax=Actinacidiphila acididurans TaxID=2784346 RepID=A0ABS2U0I1_9ACTN|nr:SDR family NAD(P)-dependent oxidoreductase [Actinacidiphila acididurans]MBM9507713.1 SDR family oxidoreductase [Actinacidiphila acididurans]
MRLRHKVAVVTGGTSGLGRRIAEALLREGAQVVCAARSERDMPAITELAGPRAAFHHVDVRDPDSVRGLMSFAQDRFGKLDICVANAGVTRDGPVHRLDPKEWDEVLDTNLTGAFHCMQAAVPYLQLSAGTLINVSSALSTRVSPGATAYSVSKAGLDMLTRAAAVELGALGIRVNAVAPGFIGEGMGSRLSDNDLVWDDYRTRLVSGRLGTGDEVGRAVVFLASPDGGYVNGHVLEVNGGLQWA